MHRVDKIKFVLFFGKPLEEPCYGYMEMNSDGQLIALFNKHGEELDMNGGHEVIKVKTLGKFDNEDRDNFYDLLESDGVG
ncbi:hypothetical protein [Paenibacillus paeoniae]|uniref:Uncharacterized protein n=1 Tax=Paenibacillus paeoniae TaxID=2292705 RepID=A0A371PI18_9BACL|nr:hypothetical protein [Paenibacillus paeoniae]REK75168.1 hypothetical protein DX130_16180 [Paenibacillus paeoniae]